MDSVIQALSRARNEVNTRPVQPPVPAEKATPIEVAGNSIPLNPARLKAHRIVSFDSANKLTLAFDVLRNTVLKETDSTKSGGLIAVTSPTVGCGVTTTAANLAFSIARMRKNNVLLVDTSPNGATLRLALGLHNSQIVSGSPENLSGIAVVEAAGVRLHVTSLWSLISDVSPRGLLPAFHAWLAVVRQQLDPVTIVLDAPPVLTDDSTVPLVADADLILLTLAVGKSTMADLEACRSYLHGANAVQLVLNKARKYDL